MKWETIFFWKKNADKRVNANTAFKDSLRIFLALVVVNGLHMYVYQQIILDGRDTVEFFIIALTGWLVFSAAVLTGLTTFIRYWSQGRPIRRLREAAKKIAAGNFAIRVTPISKDGKKDYMAVLFDDFNTMAEELESIEIMKNDFIANVSHEIKSPLSVIQSYAAALQNENLEPEERHEYIKTIVNSSQKLSALVSNILKLNKLENQKILPTTSCYELGEQLRRCALAFEDIWEQKSINFEAALDEITVSYDETMLEIVWNNLIANAIKFTAPKGVISLSLKKAADGFARIQITDSGCGMDEETQEHIFDKFYQGDSSHSQEGNGLGLALVKKVIDMTGAEITVKSRAGEGTSFTVRLKIGEKT
ncbi:Two component sensor kinase [Treponema primitia ZAS-2]|uniref:histidine kinase n=1 Tax=Treponema primitia (strain ATCC BAA-887 / DSM 12427 / ZAS-2) TaxID=545694 RepID=F5YQM9_TREPZ|nr:HAMP domain-containing sensor histidine kinase [Treponema primitia]AEF86574.1 Two component sensor kinase [Treponema primitia ZAS-2]